MGRLQRRLTAIEFDPRARSSQWSSRSWITCFRRRNSGSLCTSTALRSAAVAAIHAQADRCSRHLCPFVTADTIQQLHSGHERQQDLRVAVRRHAQQILDTVRTRLVSAQGQDCRRIENVAVCITHRGASRGAVQPEVGRPNRFSPNRAAPRSDRPAAGSREPCCLRSPTPATSLR